MGFTVTQLENGLKAYHWNTLGKVKGTYGTDYWIEYNGETLVKLGENYYLPGDTGFMDPKNTEVMSTFNASGALIAVLIFVHLIHLFLGIIYHAVNLRRIAKNRLNASNYMSLYAGGMYWHFMGILWIYLFAFLFFIY
jgi:cytochrome c oxidase subunit 3